MGSGGAAADASAGLLPDAESLSSDPLAAGRWRSQPVYAMAADGARATRSSPLPVQWSCLAGPLQGVSHSARRTSADAASVHRTQSAAGGFVARAEDRLWSSLRERGRKESGLEAVPVPGPKDWVGWVNAPMTDTAVEALRQSVNRGRLFGSEAWIHRTAHRLGLEASPNPRGVHGRVLKSRMSPLGSPWISSRLRPCVYLR